MSTPRSPAYWQLWRKTPRELGYLVLGWPIALVGFLVETVLLSAGAGTLITFFIGAFLLIAGLYIARGFAVVETTRLRWAGQPAIGKPEWQDARASEGFWGWLRSVFGNGHYWLSLLHTLIVNPILAGISWTITITWTFTALGMVSFGFWQQFITRQSEHFYLTNWLFGDGVTGGGRTLLEVVINAVVGLGLIALLPFVTRGLTLAHWGVARLMLAPFRSDALQREVIGLNASRVAAASAEGQSLRKLERDLHDGPQQRLVRLQMDLAAAQRQLEKEPAAAAELLDGAMGQAKEALEELRALSRGFAPPLLLDRGLVAALESLATRSAVPVTLVNELPSGEPLPQEIERNAYFVASELITNATKHANASKVELKLDVHDSVLDLTVTDDGQGGAVFTAGHGLAGLEERLRGLGGTLDVVSPAGGPTVATAHLPIALG